MLYMLILSSAKFYISATGALALSDKDASL